MNMIKNIKSIMGCFFQFIKFVLLMIWIPVLLGALLMAIGMMPMMTESNY